MSKAKTALTVRHRFSERTGTLKPVQFFQILRRVFTYARPYSKIRNRLIGAVLLRSLLVSSVMWAFGKVITGPIAAHDIRGTLLGTLGFASLTFVTQAAFRYRILWALELGENVIRDLRNAVFARLQELDAGFFQKMDAGRIINRMTTDLEAVRQGVQEIVFVCAVQAGQAVITGILLIQNDWVLFLVAIAIAPALWIVNQIFRTRLSNAQRRLSESFSQVAATVAESVDGIRVTQGFGREEHNAELFRDLVADHSRNVMAASRTTATFLPLLELKTQLFTALLLILGSYRVLHHSIPLGNVVQFLFLANLFFDPWRVIGTRYTQALTAMVGAERVFRLLDTKPAWTDPADAMELPRIVGRVEFRDVQFGYDPEHPVLHDISFVAEPGQTIALVGHTGSGKSSIINLLTKSYLYDTGELLIDGHDLRCAQSDSLRRQLGIVQQQNFLFTGTVAENIRFSKPNATDEEVIAAVRSLDFLDLLERLPLGLQTPVGEAGNGLSLGQRQLVCFTRAFLADPRILLLDEAISSIDAVTEARLQKALSVLLRGRTSFVVAHRLSTIRQADQILVLDHGRIVERGTHAELVERDGIYRQLHEHFVENTASR